MIFYFSATGNSKHVAERIAADGEELISIAAASDADAYYYELKDERVGIISPTYNWTLPSIVSEFLGRLSVHAEKDFYFYYVGTYGTTTGAAAAMADSIVQKTVKPFDAMFDIKMPDTWTPTFDLSDPAKVRAINDAAEREIDELTGQVARKLTGKHMGITMLVAAGMIGLEIYNNDTRKTSHLSVTDKCISCGLCARKCPAHAIQIMLDKPVWVREKCIMCLGCLHRCPAFAIECGKNTSKHGQYTNPYTRV